MRDSENFDKAAEIADRREHRITIRAEARAKKLALVRAKRLAEATDDRLRAVLAWPSSCPPRRASRYRGECRLAEFLYRHVFRPRGTPKFPGVIAELRSKRPWWFHDLVEAAGVPAPCYWPVYPGSDSRPWRPTPPMSRRLQIIKDVLLSGDVGERPLITSDDPFVRRLARYMETLLVRGSPHYDPKFAVALNRAKPSWFRGEHSSALSVKGEARPSRKAGARLKAAILVREDRPRFGHARKREHRLAIALKKYTDEDGPYFDADFAAAVRTRHPGWSEPEALTRHLTRGETQRLLLGWSDSRRPRDDRGGLEARLAAALQRWTSRRGRFYDAAFDAVIRAAKPGWNFRAPPPGPSRSARKA